MSRDKKVLAEKHVTSSRDQHHHRDNISSNATAVIKERMHSMMDIMDTRIEGVEEIMFDLQRTVHKLNKKVRIMCLVIRKKMCVSISSVNNSVAEICFTQ